MILAMNPEPCTEINNRYKTVFFLQQRHIVCLNMESPLSIVNSTFTCKFDKRIDLTSLAIVFAGENDDVYHRIFSVEKQSFAVLLCKSLAPRFWSMRVVESCVQVSRLSIKGKWLSHVCSTLWVATNQQHLLFGIWSLRGLWVLVWTLRAWQAICKHLENLNCFVDFSLNAVVTE